MRTLAYRTSVMSWQMLLSAIRRTRESNEDITSIDLNLEVPPCVVLCCIALESFANEISSLAAAFLFNEKRNGQTISTAVWKNIAQIKDDRTGSFYDRYKKLIKAVGIEKLDRMQHLSYLRDLRDAGYDHRFGHLGFDSDADKR